MLLLGSMSFGVYLTDEGAQLQGVQNVLHGSLEIEERSPHFYAVQEGVMLPGWNSTTSHNVFVSLLAVPAYGVFLTLSHVASPATILLLGWTAAAYGTTTRGWARLYHQRTGRTWSWSRPDTSTSKDEAPTLWGRAAHQFRSMSTGHWVLVAALALWTFTQWIQLPSIDFGLWGEVFAVQATHTLLSAVGFVLFFRLVQRETGSLRATWLASAFLLLGPFTFWGTGIKYHAASMVLTIATLWAYGKPGRVGKPLAFVFAALGTALTPLGAPLFLALAGIEALRTTTALMAHFSLAPANQTDPENQADETDEADDAKRADPISEHPARFAVPGLLLLGGAAVFMLFNRTTSGTWLGPMAASWDGTAGGLWSWLQDRVRYENPGRSWTNLWRVFVDARLLAGGPLSIWALSPLAALALLVPVRLRRNWPRSVAVAALASLLFVAVFVHAAHTQGDGQDNRFFATALPGFLFLGAVVAAPRLDSFHATHVRLLARSAFIGFAGSMLILLMLAAAGISIIAHDELRQVLNFAWITGTVSWATLLAIDAVPAIARRFGTPRTDRAYAIAMGLGLASSALWLFLMMIGVHRSLPPWPFGSGAEGMSFLLPSLESVRMWWIPRILP